MNKKVKALFITGALLVSSVSFVTQAEAKVPNITKEHALKNIKLNFSGDVKKKKSFTSKTYKDVKSNNSTVKWAYEYGFISKTKSGSYKPKSYITREQAMKALVRGLDIKASKKKGKTKDATTTELKIMDSWGELPKDKKGKFNPKGKLTDDQMWSFIDAAANAKDKYLVATTPVEVNWYYPQKGEKIPTYGKALDYNQYKKAARSLQLNPDNKVKFKVVYVKNKNYIQKYNEEEVFGTDYYEEMYNPYTRNGLSTPYGAQKKGNVYRIVMHVIPKVSDKQFKESNDEFNKMYSEIKKTYTIKTDYDAVVAVNKYVANKFEYGEDMLNHKKLFAGQDGIVLCENYEYTAGYLLKKFGLKVKDLSGSYHGWLGVKVGGDWYHSDPTFLSTSKQEKNILMTDSVRFTGKITSYYKDTNTIKTPKEAFNPANALPIKVK